MHTTVDRNVLRPNLIYLATQSETQLTWTGNFVVDDFIVSECHFSFFHSYVGFNFKVDYIFSIYLGRYVLSIET